MHRMGCAHEQHSYYYVCVVRSSHQYQQLVLAPKLTNVNAISVAKGLLLGGIVISA